MSIVLTRATKQAARYTDAGGRERCSGCRFFMPQGTCGRIIGPVSAKGWCKYYSQEAVQRWQPQGAIGFGMGPSLSLNFMNPGTSPTGLSFTRTSTGTYFDGTGTMQTAAVNAPRWDYDPVTHALRGMLIEEARINVLLNSATLGTQGVAVTAQAYTLSFYGTGTITMSGAFAGSLVGASPNRAATTFTPAAGTLTCTVTGSVLNAQLEAGSFNTSWIPTTAAAVTRAVETMTIPAGSWFVAGAQSWYAELVHEMPSTALNPRVISGPATNFGPLFITSTGNMATYDGSGVVQTANGAGMGTLMKGAVSWQSNVGNVCLNAGAVATGAQTTGYAGTTTVKFFGDNAGSDTCSGWLRNVRYWPRALSNAELQSVTS